MLSQIILHPGGHWPSQTGCPGWRPFQQDGLPGAQAVQRQAGGPALPVTAHVLSAGQRGQIVRRPPGRIQARQTRCSVPAATARSCASKPAPNAKAGYTV